MGLLVGLVFLGMPSVCKNLTLFATEVKSRVQALPTQAKVVIDGKEVSFEAYSIEDSHYFKLRDLAQAINGTAAQFAVEWDDNKQAIDLITNRPYVAVGGELGKGDGSTKEALLLKKPIYKDNNKVSLAAYTIKDVNYFKLRDLATHLDFYLGWDAVTHTIYIHTELTHTGAIKQPADTTLPEPFFLDEENLQIPVTTPLQYPRSQKDYEDIILYMVANKQDTYELTYNSAMRQSFQDKILSEMILEAHKQVFYDFPEYFCYKNMMEASMRGTYSSGTLTLKLTNSGIDTYKANQMRDTFFEEVKQLAQQLIDEGTITQDMTEKEKARALYEWVVLNLEYDTDYTEEGYTGYGALINRKAVCQGYTALYNSLCKLVGIQIEGIGGYAGEDNENHIWSVATLDGEEVFIDTTFGDPVPDQKGVCDFRYFSIDEGTLRKTHSW